MTRPIIVTLAALLVSQSGAGASIQIPSQQSVVSRALALVPDAARAHTTVVSRNNAVLYAAEKGPEFTSGKPVQPGSRRWMVSAEIHEVVTIPAQPPKPQSLTRQPTPAGSAFNTEAPPGLAQLDAPFAYDTGALHAVRSINGYSALHLNISIPCGTGHFQSAHGSDTETGFVYVGGWGSGDSGTPVDAGLQKSSSQKIGPEDYAAYWKYDNNPPITAWPRFDCGARDITIEFYPLANDLLYFSARGHVEGGATITVALVQVTLPSEGWRRDGGSSSNGAILKRMITIAQPPSRAATMPHFGQSLTGDVLFRYVQQLPRLRNGSYFGLVHGSGAPALHWSDCRIGRVGANGLPQFVTWSRKQIFNAGATNGFYDLPPRNPYSRGVISQWTKNEDTAAIDLRSPTTLAR